VEDAGSDGKERSDRTYFQSTSGDANPGPQTHERNLRTKV